MPLQLDPETKMKLISKSIKARRGRILFHRPFIEEALTGDQERTALWNAFTNGLVIVRAEADFASDCIEYTCYHPQFEEMPDGFLSPRYGVDITRTVDHLGVVTFGCKFTKL